MLQTQDIDHKYGQVDMKLTKGIELIEEIVGEGPVADKGALVIYNARFFLRRGEEVTQDAGIISRARAHLRTRIVDGFELIDHETELGKRQTIAGVEKSLYGMKRNGYREVLVSPHLAYREQGVTDLIAANSMLRIQLWVRDVARPFS